MAIVRAAVVQAASVAFDRDRSLERVRLLATEAAGLGAQLIVFPEAFVSGYPRGLDFGSRIGSRTAEGRDQFRRYWESAVDVPGPATAALGDSARKANAHLVIGVVEREGGTLYCSVLFFAPDGRLLGKHRKLMPTAAERLVWGFGDGSTMPVLDTSIGRLGAAICWENYMPLLRMHLYSQGVQLYCAPTADNRETWQATARHIALEGRCFVLSCNQFALRSDYPDDYPADQGDDPQTVMSQGGSCIIDPLGQVLAGPLYDEPGILTADLDLDEIARGKFDLDVVGHYARPDIFRLTVNTTPTPSVVVETGGPHTELPGTPSGPTPRAVSTENGANPR
ncbi:carbon-nitrogen hydrolase family protein [Singulisphaera acidiphila]|uniref:Putative amidohydrolase n=1 Tax=Singulisphaera acidiphila (strain ATCC BAA-1392 / DSM 18658 / VKM B-2454 / MOB10) TaxID=886293 RepID=L0D9V2_SINAD|nr:carbon-nitrogen hydrolase family protein [Singulisphaera acidiphila]AGA25650.1 putative amidohydrolase [Singulisphaera acidiphila DSM 18658]